MTEKQFVNQECQKFDTNLPAWLYNLTTYFTGDGRNPSLLAPLVRARYPPGVVDKTPPFRAIVQQILLLSQFFFELLWTTSRIAIRSAIVVNCEVILLLSSGALILKEVVAIWFHFLVVLAKAIPHIGLLILAYIPLTVLRLINRVLRKC